MRDNQQTITDRHYSAIAWPCLLKLEGDDELLFIASYQAFIHECDELIFTEHDCIIDSEGRSYSIHAVGCGLDFEPQKTVTLQQITELVQAHEFSHQQVCIIKIQFLKVADAILALQPSH